MSSIEARRFVLCCERSARQREGFVLLEAVVALAIIGIFAVALLAATGTQVQSSNKSAVLLTARSLAEDRMEAIRMLDNDGMNDVPDSLKSGQFGPPFDAFTWTATVAPVKDEYDLFDVQIVISSGNEAYPLRTLMHQPRPAAEAGNL